MLKQKKPHVGQDEKKMTPEVDSLKMTDLILVIIYNVLLTFWTFAYKPNVFYHGHGWMLVLKTDSKEKNLFNCWVVANYLCLVSLDYLGEFLYYKILISWPLQN